MAEPYGLLGARELAERVCTAFGYSYYEHLRITVVVPLSYTKDLKY